MAKQVIYEVVEVLKKVLDECRYVEFAPSGLHFEDGDTFKYAQDIIRRIEYGKAKDEIDEKEKLIKFGYWLRDNYRDIFGIDISIVLEDFLSEQKDDSGK